MALAASPVSGADARAHAAHARRRADGFERHRPEQTVLYRVVEQHWPAEQAAAPEDLPSQAPV
jgi:hypothetical protein